MECASLLQKSRKAKHVFVSHSDRDHVTGLLQFNQLNARPDLHIHYPADSGSLPALAYFTSKFDSYVQGTNWNAVRPGDEVALRSNLVVTAIENSHIVTDAETTNSLSYVVQSVSRKLKPEYVGKATLEIASLRKDLGVEAITNEVRATKLIYSGDTPVEYDGRYNDASVLIHEATLLTREEIAPDDTRYNKHSSLDAVMEMVADSRIRTLILGHFSSRYSNEQIDVAIHREIKRCGITIPVLRVYPGELAKFEIET